MNDDQPVVPATVSLPEITVKAVILSIVLAAILAAANAYLGLFAGMTVSASIPAAVASMAILRLFHRSNILENNIVQTAASSGEALAAGVIFTIPALLLVGYWADFEYWQTTVIATVGGLLGVLFTIPLRRALSVTTRLRFPEGVATAEVLKVGAAGRPENAPADSTRDFRALFSAALLGGAVKFGESGLRLWADSLDGADAGIWTLQWSATRSNRIGGGDGDLERPDPLCRDRSDADRRTLDARDVARAGVEQ